MSAATLKYQISEEEWAAASEQAYIYASSSDSATATILFHAPLSQHKLVVGRDVSIEVHYEWFPMTTKTRFPALRLALRVELSFPDPGKAMLFKLSCLRSAL